MSIFTTGHTVQTSLPLEAASAYMAYIRVKPYSGRLLSWPAFILTINSDIYFRFRCGKSIIRHTFVRSAIAHVHTQDIQLVHTWNHSVWQSSKSNLSPRDADGISFKLARELPLFVGGKNLLLFVSCTDSHFDSI